MFKRPTRIEPAPGQESVWDYPRPPALEKVEARLRVVFAGEVIADTTRGHRVLETSHPPVYYLPPQDVRMELLSVQSGASFCEWKGSARYWTIRVAGPSGMRESPRAAWSYPDPTPVFQPIMDSLAFYASKVDECWVDDEQVAAQAGDFYGGWITSKIVGPFKGAPGTMGW